MGDRREEKGRAEETLKNVLGEISRGHVHPCYFLYGDEDYLVEGAARSIIDALLPDQDRDLNLFLLDGDPEDARDLFSAVLTPPLIAGRKVIVLRNTRLFYSKSTAPELLRKVIDSIDSNPQLAAKSFTAFLAMTGWTLEDFRDGKWSRISDEEWVKTAGGEPGENRGTWLPRVVDFCTTHQVAGGPQGDASKVVEELLAMGVPEGHVLVFTADAVDKRKRVFKIVSEQGPAIAFTRARGEAQQKKALIDNVDEFLSRRGKKLSPDAWLALGRKTGFKFRESVEAMEMLVTYTGERAVISGNDVEEVIGKTREDSVFDLLSSIQEKDLDKALLYLGDLLRQGVHHLMILTMIIREIRLLLHAKILLGSGRLKSFRPAMEYSAFLASVYPRLAEAFGEAGEKGFFLAEQHPYVIYNALRNCGRVTQERLMAHADRLVEMDVALKSTGRDPRLMLERLVVDLCQEGPKNL